MTEARRHRPVEARVGGLLIRLAETPDEVRASQRLRYRVFCEEMAAKPTREMVLARREFDSFDAFCDHLLVFDCDQGFGEGDVVGTYRLMRRPAAAKRGQFYSAAEYDIAPIEAYQGEILELGRSCIDPAYRTGAAMQLLWRGIAAYVFAHRIKVLFGCASLPGTDPSDHALALSYLYHMHLAPPELRPVARPELRVAMDMLGAEEIAVRQAQRSLPPLIKGYLRLGGMVGDGAVVDQDFGTTDVCIIVKIDQVTEKYSRHYVLQEAAALEIED